jgi:nucleoside-diphosphate-sugar epimerase
MTESNGETVLVTGGHGFLGSHLVEMLLSAGFRVRCLLRADRAPDVFGGLPVEVARGDLRAEQGLDEAARGVGLVMHVAGLIAARSPAEFRAVNAAGTLRLAAAVARASPRCRRFVYVSSQAAAGPSPDGRPLVEECEPRPVSHYGRSKLEGERLLPPALGRVPLAVVRPPAIYGPRDEALLPFFQAAARGLAPGLEGRGRRFNLLHARDVARGILLAATREEARGRTYFLADPAGYGYGDLARGLGAAFGTRPRVLPLPDCLLDLAGALTDEVAGLTGAVPVFGRQKALELKQRWWLCSAGRAEREIGWRPLVPLAEGLAETARWYVRAGKVRTRGEGPSSL